MGGHPNAYDRFWFNGYDEHHYFAVALGLYPTRGVIDAAFAVTDGATQRSVFCGDALVGRPTKVGAITIEIVEPLRVNRVIVDAPEQGLSADLTYEARVGAIEEARQSIYDGGRIFMDTVRASQMGTWRGTIETPDGTFSVDGFLGTKDRSWGIRPVGEQIGGAPSTRAPQFCFFWAPINLSRSIAHYMSIDDADGQPVARSAAMGAVHTDPAHVEGSLSLQPRRGTRQFVGATINVGDQSIKLEPLFTFHMRGAGYQHPTYAHGRWHNGPYRDGEVLDVASIDPMDFFNLHVQQVVRATSSEDAGMGVLESIILGPHAPTGLTGLLDPAS